MNKQLFNLFLRAYLIYILLSFSAPCISKCYSERHEKMFPRGFFISVVSQHDGMSVPLYFIKESNTF